MDKNALKLISVMTDVAIAIELMSEGADPYRVLRIAKNQSKNGTAERRMLETLLKEKISYLKKAVCVL